MLGAVGKTEKVKDARRLANEFALRGGQPDEVAIFALRKSRRRAKRQATESSMRQEMSTPQSASFAGKICRSATNSTTETVSPLRLTQ